VNAHLETSIPGIILRQADIGALARPAFPGEHPGATLGVAERQGQTAARNMGAA